MIKGLKISERDFLKQVEELLKLFGWMYSHTYEQAHYARRSTKGFPDIVAVRLALDLRLLFIELKSEKGIVTIEQQEWLDALGATGKCEVYIWRPSQFKEIAEILR